MSEYKLSHSGQQIDELLNKVDNISLGGGFPSEKYENITLKPSGGTYIAPDDGYYFFSAVANGSNAWCYMRNNNTGFATQPSNSTKNGINGFLPIRKGEELYMEYNQCDIYEFRFYYAEKSALPTTHVSGGCVPSDYFEDWGELKENLASYVAPADGWVVVNKVAGGSNRYVYIRRFFPNTDNSEYSAILSSHHQSDSALCVCFCPMAKGQEFIIQYNCTGATRYFGFLYAKGQEPNQ